MDAIEALTTRQSATRLDYPAPPDDVLEHVFRAAARAPDHGRLRPWAFVCIRDEGRTKFGELLAESLRRRQPETNETVLAREREKALRAPLIIVAAARVNPTHPKIPEIEQVLSAGAAAQNIMLGLHAAGFGAMWKTGDAAYDPEVKAALGLQPHDHIVGFIYAGTSVVAPPKFPEARPAEFVRAWPG